MISNIKYLVTNERKISLENSINKELKKLQPVLTKLKENNLSSELSNTIIKSISLSKALNASENSILNNVVTSKILSEKALKNIDMVSNAELALKTGKFDILKKMDKDLTASLKSLSHLTSEAHSELSRAENKIFTEEISSSLKKLGHQVKLKSLSDGSYLLRGLKESTSFAVQVSKDGIEVDLAGFEDGKCKEVLSELKSDLAEKGISLSVKESVFHGKKEGGGLVKRVNNEISFSPFEMPTVKKIKQNVSKIKI